ncbi:hypothetical protein DFP73DRAFT_629780 [Morchella snyderi]|nr:hypothetical protein DFP73DRAFT_629780 [Morchella snyderi]
MPQMQQKSPQLAASTNPASRNDSRTPLMKMTFAPRPPPASSIPLITADTCIESTRWAATCRVVGTRYIYSCEYAALAAEYTADRNLVTPEPIPFWPAPANAPGACSCNIGEAFVNSSQLYLGSTGCTSLDIPDLFGCACCSIDGALSALYAICPNNNPDFLGYAEYYKALKSHESQLSIGTCANAIAGNNCASKWGIDPPPPPAGGKFLDPDSLSKSFGTDALSTVSGTLTALPGGPTITWSISGLELTITAASAAAAAAAATVVVTTTDSRGQTVVSTGAAVGTRGVVSGWVGVVVAVGWVMWVL